MYIGGWVSVGETSPTALLMEEVGQQLCRTPLSTTSRSFTPGFFLISVECGSFHSVGAEVEPLRGTLFVTKEALILFPQLIIVAFYLCILR